MVAIALSCRSRGATIVTKYIKRVFIYFAFIVTAANAERQADVVIVERVQHLTIFNQYQQRATAQDMLGILPFTPFVVTREDDLLGDGFTRCMKVEAGGRLFFFEKDSSGDLHRSASLGFLSTLRKVTLLNDTIEVLKKNRLAREDIVGNGSETLEPGARIIRLFVHRGKTYVRTMGVVERYGWMSFAGRTRDVDWGFVKIAEASVAEQLQKVLPQVQEKALAVNEKLARLYDTFSRQSSRTLLPPQWEVRDSSLAIICLLQPDSIRAGHAQSTRLLSKSIEGFLLGSRLRATASPGRIEIR